MAERWNTICRASGFPVLAIILASCGGGSDVPGECFSPTPGVCAAVGVPRSFPHPVPPSPTGMYKGISNNGRTVTGLVLDDHSFYTFYSAINNPAIAAGAVQGTIRTDANNFMSTDAVDINIEGLGIQSATVSGTFDTKQFINGAINYPTSRQSVSFTANYSSEFEVTPDPSVIAGKYIVSSPIGNGAGTATFTIDGSGNINGKDTSGCTFSGTAKPRSGGPAYTVTVTFGASPCTFPGNTANGISFFDRTSNLIYAVGTLANQNAGFVTIATKQ